MGTTKTSEFQVIGKNKEALFSLKVHRGEGMLLLAMDWKKGKPTRDFVGFAIEYKEPNGHQYYALKNRLTFPDTQGKVSYASVSTLLAPIQKFRWVHFPRNADLKGLFSYRVTPVFMNESSELSYGEPQIAEIALQRETYPDKLNVTFTRGFVSSQAFVDKYEKDGGMSTLLPGKAKGGLHFKPSHPKKNEALPWMGFEAKEAILDLLDAAIQDPKAEVRVVAYDLNLPEIVDRMVALGNRLKIIIDDSGEHEEHDASETEAATLLIASTGGLVKRQHMGQLQHNKTIVVKSPDLKAAVCGSTNFTWRGFYVQANNAIIIHGAKAIQPFWDAFEHYWQYDTVKDFGKTTSAQWTDLKITGVDAKASFSPHAADNALLDEIALDIKTQTKSSLFYSLAFLFQTSGSIRDAITELTLNDKLFVYGVSDKKVGGLDILKPNGNIAPVYPSEITKNFPEPFKSEPKGGAGARMHHKFVVMDFNKPNARVYMGSYNFSPTADRKNGENLLCIQDRKIAVSYMIEALRIIDHYHFRVALKESKKSGTPMGLQKPPSTAQDKPWWEEYYSNPRKVRDRELFS